MAQQDMHDDPQQLELLRVARIGRAQGLKGEVTVRLYTDDPEWRFEPDSGLYSQDGETEYIVEGSRTFKDRWILKLEGVDDRNAAEALNGVELYGEVDDAEDMLEADGAGREGLSRQHGAGAIWPGQQGPDGRWWM